MIKLAPRKAALLGAIALLAVVYIAQLVLDGRAGAKTLEADGIDMLTVEKTDGSLYILSKTGDIWTIGSGNGSTDRVPADQSKAAVFASALESVKVLGVVSSGGSASRFGFTEGTGGEDAPNLTITARAKGKKVRTIVAGKAASVPSQTYVRADGSSDVLLVSGDYLARFDVTVDDLKQKEAPAPVVDAGGSADDAGVADDAGGSADGAPALQTQ